MPDKFMGVFEPFKHPLLEQRLQEHQVPVVDNLRSEDIDSYMRYATEDDGRERFREFCEKNPFKKYLVGMSEFMLTCIQAVLFVSIFAIPAFTVGETSITQRIAVSIVGTIILGVFAFTPPYIKKLQYSLRGREWLESNPALFAYEHPMDVIKEICECTTDTCTHPQFNFLVSHHPRNPTRFLSVQGTDTDARNLYFLASWEKPSEEKPQS